MPAPERAAVAAAIVQALTDEEKRMVRTTENCERVRRMNSVGAGRSIG
jgi:hypothetical protein